MSGSRKRATAKAAAVVSDDENDYASKRAKNNEAVNR